MSKEEALYQPFPSAEDGWRATFGSGILAAAFLSSLASSQVVAWEFQKQGDVLVATVSVGEWGAYYSGTSQEAVFCFVGPYRVGTGSSYPVKLRIGSGPWLDAQFNAYDHETLCETKTKTAHGLVGGLVKYGSIDFGLYVGEVFKQFRVTNEDWLERLK